jgi:ABC-type microcin C transport system permease subunit YejE
MATLAFDRPRERERVFGVPVRVSRLNARRLANFRANRRGYISLYVFTFMFVTSLFANLIANDKPLLVAYDGGFYFPILQSYPETTFGGDFPTETDYTDPFVIDLIREKGWLLWPIIPYSYNTVIRDLPTPAPSPPSWQNWLGFSKPIRCLAPLARTKNVAVVPPCRLIAASYLFRRIRQAVLSRD